LSISAIVGYDMECTYWLIYGGILEGVTVNELTQDEKERSYQIKVSLSEKCRI